MNKIDMFGFDRAPIWSSLVMVSLSELVSLYEDIPVCRWLLRMVIASILYSFHKAQNCVKRDRNHKRHSDQPNIPKREKKKKKRKRKKKTVIRKEIRNPLASQKGFVDAFFRTILPGVSDFF